MTKNPLSYAKRSLGPGRPGGALPKYGCKSATRKSKANFVSIGKWTQGVGGEGTIGGEFPFLVIRMGDLV